MSNNPQEALALRRYLRVLQAFMLEVTLHMRSLHCRDPQSAAMDLFTEAIVPAECSAMQWGQMVTVLKHPLLRDKHVA